MAGNLPRPGNRQFQIVNYIGIAEQLLSTHANRLLEDTGLPLAQFIMLNHFSHEPELGRTVTEVASAMQQPQPTVTKMLKRLVAKRYLAVRSNSADGRLKVHVLTSKGQDAHRAALSALIPDIERIFRDWPAEDIDALHGLLFRLMRFLDADRI